MTVTDELFTTYGPIFFKAIPKRGLERVNEIRETQGLDKIATSGLSSSWEEVEDGAQKQERKEPLPDDPIVFLLGK